MLSLVFIMSLGVGQQHEAWRCVVDGTLDGGGGLEEGRHARGWQFDRDSHEWRKDARKALGMWMVYCASM